MKSSYETYLSKFLAHNPAQSNPTRASPLQSVHNRVLWIAASVCRRREWRILASTCRLPTPLTKAASWGESVCVSLIGAIRRSFVRPSKRRCETHCCRRRRGPRPARPPWLRASPGGRPRRSAPMRKFVCAHTSVHFSVFVYVCISHTDACMYVCVFVRVVTCMLMFVCSNIYVRKIQIIIQNKYKHTKNRQTISIPVSTSLTHVQSLNHT